VANAYYDLLVNLWSDSSGEAYNPIDFKYQFDMIKNDFFGSQQHDAPEFFTSLLTSLHEDLNRAQIAIMRNTREISDIESNIEAAALAWEDYKKGADSVVVDLFAGQSMSERTCSQCFVVKRNFDSFFSLILPIPNIVQIELYVVPRISTMSIIKLTVSVSKNALFYDIDSHINNLTDNLFKRFKCVEVDKDYKITKIFNGHDSLGQYNNSPTNKIFCYEIDPHMLEIEYYTFPVYFVSESNQKVCFPRMLTVAAKQTYKDLKRILYGFLMPFSEILNDKLRSKYPSGKMKNVEFGQYESLVEEHFDEVYGEKKMNDIMDPFEVAFITVQTGAKRKIFTTATIFDILDWVDTQSVTDIIDLAGGKLEIQISLGSSNITKTLNSIDTSYTPNTTPLLSLHNCLEEYLRIEQMEQNCECVGNKDTTFFLREGIAWAPKILAISFKRFNKDGEKIENSIDFPINNFDFSRYVIADNKQKLIYDLYAVLKHEGKTPDSGHYITIAKNPQKEWYVFNDSRVTPIEENEIKDKSAYMLFYKLQD
jgi:ubiquitin C-terminal hydrolase